MSCQHAHCCLKTLAALKPGWRKLHQGCFNQAPMLSHQLTSVQRAKKWAICRCWVAAWCWIETFEIVAAVHTALTLALMPISVLLAQLFN